MGTIIFYNLNNTLHSKLPLNKKYLGNINGKMSRCHLLDGRIIDGYGAPYGTLDSLIMRFKILSIYIHGITMKN